MSTFSPEKSEAGNKFSDDLRSQGITNANYARSNFSPIIRPGENGFMPYQMAGLNVFAQQLMGQQSADWAARGFTNPQNLNAVIGSSLTQAAPNLFNLQNQNQLLPGQIVGSNIGNVNDALMPLINGGQFNRSKGSGLGYNAVNSFTSNLSKWAGPGGAGQGKGFAGGGKGVPQ